MSSAPRETVAPDEEARFNAFAAEIREIQRKRAERRGASERGLHPKAHVGAVAKLAVGEVPVEYRVALFSAPAEFDCYVRFSNGAPRTQPDGRPDIRGVALKVVGVPGKKIIKGLEDKKTQDFLFITTAATAVRSPDEFMHLIRSAAEGPALLVPKLLKAVGLRRALSIVKAATATPRVRSMATVPFFTAAPIRFGESAVKVAIFPVSSASHIPSKGPGALRDDLVARLKSAPVVYSLRVQRYVDEASTPIEDTSVEWTSPWQEVATLSLPQQDVLSERGREIEERVESLSFDPWHAVEALRPLGAMMRARAAAYRDSVIERKAADEPESVLTPTA